MNRPADSTPSPEGGPQEEHALETGRGLETGDLETGTGAQVNEPPAVAMSSAFVGSSEGVGDAGESGDPGASQDAGASDDAVVSAPPIPSSVRWTAADGPRPTFKFFGIVSAISLAADVLTKVWAEITLNARVHRPIEVIDDHLSITLAYNQGGAWGLLQNASEMVRKPFFLGVSVLAILFIVSLYGRLHPKQTALKWGLPLVLGGALGNLSDRITRSQVIDFIDYRADWVLSMNRFIREYVKTWTLTDHWPTFNVADIAICVGVGLMAIDMFTSRRRVAAPRSHAPVSTTPSPQSPSPQGN